MKNNQIGAICVGEKSYAIETNPAKSTVFNTEFTPQDMVEYCGLIPKFATEGGKTFRENLDDNYVYGTNWSSEATVDENYVYHYPQDEPLVPIIMIHDLDSDDQVIMYPYGITAVRDNGKWVTSRLD